MNKITYNELPKLVIGIGLIFNNLGEVLIDQRHHHTKMGGLWEFPGGKKEEGESIESTIIREIYEELAIQIIVQDKLIEFTHSYTHSDIHFVVYFCKLLHGEPKPLESLQLKWVHPNQLSDYPFPDANKKMISALQDYLFLHK